MGSIQRGHSPAVFSFHTFIYTLWVVLLEVSMRFDASVCLETEEESVPSFCLGGRADSHSPSRST